MKKKIFCYGIIVLLSLSAAMCGKKSNELDYGTVKNSVYTNNYFGLEVKFPEKWYLQSQAEQKKLMEEGGKFMAGDDKNIKAAIKASEQKTVNLFAVFNYAPGSPVPFNANMAAIAEKVDHIPGIKKGSDYLFHTKRAFAATQLKIDITKDGYSKKLGNVDFDSMATAMNLRGITVKQEYYVTIQKGYALLFIISYSNDNQRKGLHEIVNSVNFKK